MSNFADIWPKTGVQTWSDLPMLVQQHIYSYSNEYDSAFGCLGKILVAPSLTHIVFDPGRNIFALSPWAPTMLHGNHSIAGDLNHGHRQTAWWWTGLLRSTTLPRQHGDSKDCSHGRCLAAQGRAGRPWVGEMTCGQIGAIGAAGPSWLPLGNIHELGFLLFKSGNFI